MSSSPTIGSPLRSQNSIVLSSHRTPHPFFTPTHLSFTDAHSGTKAGSWQSRRARKGRYAPQKSHVHYIGPKSAAAGADAEEGNVPKGKGKETEVQKMEKMAYSRMKSGETKLKPHLIVDVSFWIAIAFTAGSIVWVVNGYLVWFPIIRPELATTTFSRTAAATAFIGGTIFEIGSYLMVVEALDRGREINFGTALGQVLHHRRKTPSHTSLALEDVKSQIEHDTGRTSTTSSGTLHQSNGEAVRGKIDNDDEANGISWPAGAKGFVWWGKPMWHDLGYLAALVQLFAATIFWVSTITGLPGVIPGFAEGEGSKAIVDIFFWTPQVIGGCGFILSALILMIEVQKKWYLPNLFDVGWQVGVWNLIGAFGFMLCGALGYSDKSGVVYESGLSTFWGSWAFLIGSGFQLWEVIWREPPKQTDTSTPSKRA
ncbi:hypothetical protein CI109_107136 [Kwoniella shandongensis]|uniref:Uncharacterized protein n=1 Tax=Kwoniella shandongensis TaxID=1734106 RepID=A0A5M6C1S2_9TREE|nr:uncharacterized protein CI109_002419 [Kwoniella shandongensis]KAA5529078.1 hypothetical protein CI109_002419 [Kwoniella shandongensis]